MMTIRTIAILVNSMIQITQPTIHLTLKTEQGLPSKTDFKTRKQTAILINQTMKTKILNMTQKQQQTTTA